MNNTTKYDITYDPFYNATPGANTEYAPSYWVTTAGKQPDNDGILQNTVRTDVAIIGGGFTGLATAMFLAKEYNVKAIVLEANQIGWGCTSRNGGQGHVSWGRLSRSQWAKKWGVEMAKKIHHNTLDGFEIFTSLANDEDINCEPFGNGNILIAHNTSALKKLQKESDFCNLILKYRTKIIPTQQVHQQYLKDEESKGAMVEPLGIAVHPLKLAFGYMRIAKRFNAIIHTGSPVVKWEQNGNKHHLITPRGKVIANKVVIATAGYTHKSLHPLLSYKNMPIMANNAVTATLTDEQIKECGFKTHMYFTDSRKLRFYYRFLPDNRLQIGTRSAISGASVSNPIHLRIVKDAIARKFPSLKNIKIDYFCSGWMDISHDMMPRIVKPEKHQEIYYAQGYSGNGVAFSSYAAKKLAELVTGKTIKEKDLPIFSSPLPSHPLRILRRPGQRILFKYFSILDRLP